jgi:RNA polymerase sigma factor (sigma-70 family)
MQRDQGGSILQYLRKILSDPRIERVSDRVLLQRFVGLHDEDAFGALVRRHGPMVWHLCRRLLRHDHDAEDVCQATFCVLASKAASRYWHLSVASWLHQVAYHLALRANAAATRRSLHERQAICRESIDDPVDAISERELRAVLDEELASLPEKYRAPLVLCYLEGRTRDQAARLLGLPLSTLKSRVDRGCELLRLRLDERGLTVSCGLSSAVLIPAGAAMSARFWTRVAHGALAFANPKTAAVASLSPPAFGLAKVALDSMALARLKIAAALFLVSALFVGGAGAIAHSAFSKDETSEAATSVPNQPAETPRPIGRDSAQPSRLDLHGDPLPDGVIARLGTTRLRHGLNLRWLEFTPDGKSLISQGGDGVAIWNAETGQQLHFFPKEQESRSQMQHESTSLSVDGKLVAFSGTSAVHIHDVATGKRVQTIETGSNLFPRFSPDGKTLAVQSDKKPWPYGLWDISSGKQLFSFGEDPAYFACMTFTPDGKTLITAGSSFNSSPPKLDHKMCFWDAATGKELQRIPMGAASAHRLAISPDGKMMAMICYGENSGTENFIRIRDLETGKEVRRLVVGPEGDMRYSTALAFAPDGKTLYSAGQDEKVIAWNPHTGEELRRIGKNLMRPEALAVSPDGKTLAVSVFFEAIRLIDANNGQDRLPSAGHESYILYSAVSGDGRTVATGDPYNVFVWDSNSGRELYRLESEQAMSLQGPVESGKSFLTMDLHLPNKAQTLTLRVRDFQTGKVRRQKEWHLEKGERFSYVSVAPDGRTLAVPGRNGAAAMLVDLESGKEIRAIGTVAPGDTVQGPHFLPDGRTLAVRGPGSRIRLWDIQDGRLLRDFQGTLEKGQPRGPVAIGGPVPPKAVVSPVGTLLAVYQKGTTFLAFQDMATGKLTRRLDQLPGGVGTVAFAPDGRTLAWANSGDGSFHLVEVSTGREREHLNGHKGPVMSVGFSPDGKYLISGSRDTTALVWDLTGQRSGKTPLAKKLAAAELDVCWKTLAGEDAVQAFTAAKQLVAAPADAVAYLRTRLTPVPAVDAKRVADLIVDLDSDAFPVRQAATQQLEKVGEPAAGQLQNALTGKQSLEFTRRIQGLLEKTAQKWQNPGPDDLRILRSIEVLENIGTTEAQAVLSQLAGGAAGARLTQEAAGSLERLAARSN